MSAAAVLATPEVMPGVPAEPGAPVVVEGMPMVYAQAPVAYAPQVVTYGAMPEQYVYAAPPMQQVVYVNEAGQQVDEAGNLVQVEGQVMEGQVMYAAPEAQQILYVDEHGQPVEAPEGAVLSNRCCTLLHRRWQRLRASMSPQRSSPSWQPVAR